MQKINEIIVEIERDKDCMVRKLPIPNKNVPLGLPEDLTFYFLSKGSLFNKNSGANRI